MDRAPLVPAFHREIFASKLKNRVILILVVLPISVWQRGGYFGFDTAQAICYGYVEQTHFGRPMTKRVAGPHAALLTAHCNAVKACDFSSQPCQKVQAGIVQSTVA